jgi:N-acetylglutamate synthase-like GNAT family acetyltransferase
MNANDFKVRRATIEDLPALNALWKTMNFGVLELEKRLTEFQVAVDSNGSVAGAIGYQMQGKQALIHSEAFTDFSLTDTLRPLLWERLKMLAANHGTVRVWSKEDSRFWAQETLTKPDADALEKLPANWAAQPGEWRTLKLREDVEEVLSLDKEFAMFAEAERERSRSALNQAKLLKTIATVIALILGLIVLVGVGLMLMHKYRPPAQ